MPEAVKTYTCELSVDWNESGAYIINKVKIGTRTLTLVSKASCEIATDLINNEKAALTARAWQNSPEAVIK